MVYKHLSEWLTTIENPRTRRDFENSVLYKVYLLSFANNYTVVIYTAFFKGMFHLPPRDSKLTNLEKDICQPLSCTIDLTTQLFFLMAFRRTIWHIISLCFRLIVLKCKTFLKKTRKSLPQFEEEYRLKPMTKNFLLSSYCEMIIQYGFVTFFVAALPLAPLYALLSNLLEMRMEAKNMIKRFRRPIPKVVAGIGAWDGILLGVTYLSAATNAFVIAFSSQFVEREVYKYEQNTTKGFIKYTLSEFATKDYAAYDKIKIKNETCYYLAMRYPPSHKYQYDLSGEYWTNFTWKLVFIIVFEHLILMCNTLMSYCIRDVPYSVTELLSYERQMKREALVKLPANQSKLMAMPNRTISNLVDTVK